MWFKKKSVVEEKKPKPRTVIHYEPKKFNVGYSYVRITFADTREFITKIYGDVYQFVDHGDYFSRNKDPKMGIQVGILSINHSKDLAKQFVENITGEQATFCNDSKDVRESIVGCPISAELLTSHDYEIEHSVASIKVV